MPQLHLVHRQRAKSFSLFRQSPTIVCTVDLCRFLFTAGFSRLFGLMLWGSGGNLWSALSPRHLRINEDEVDTPQKTQKAKHSTLRQQRDGVEHASLVGGINLHHQCRHILCWLCSGQQNFRSQPSTRNANSPKNGPSTIITSSIWDWTSFQGGATTTGW